MGRISHLLLPEDEREEEEIRISDLLDLGPAKESMALLTRGLPESVPPSEDPEAAAEFKQAAQERNREGFLAESLFEEGAEQSLNQPALVRNVVGGLGEAGFTIKAVVQRVLQDEEGARETHRTAQQFAQIQGSADEFSGSPLLNRAVRSATASAAQMIPLAVVGFATGTGALPVIAGFGIMRTNSALSEALDAGFSEDKALLYAVVAGTIEAGITTIFQGMGRGGLESLFGKTVSIEAAMQAGRVLAKQGLAAGLKRMGKRGIEELTEEEIITLLDTVASKISNIDPESFDQKGFFGVWRDAAIDTLAATALTMGVVETAMGGGRRLAGARRADLSDEIDETVDPISGRPRGAEETINVEPEPTETETTPETVRPEGPAEVRPDRQDQAGLDAETERADLEDETTTEPEPEPAVEPAEETTREDAGKVDPAFPVDDIEVDADRFQFKIGPGAEGTTGSLSGVSKFDPDLAGVVLVWRDPNTGKVFVVNGHNRVALAKRAKRSGQRNASTLAVRFLDAETAAEARAKGALTNIAEGRGTSLDAAKFFRDSSLSEQDVQEMGIPLRQSTAKEGLGLSKLAPALFNMVVDGDLTAKRGALIGEKIEDHNIQLQLVDEILREEKRGKTVTNAVVSELVDQVNSGPTTTERQETLFGDELVDRSGAFDRARLASTIRERLSKDKRLFSLVSKNAENLERGGNVIDPAKSAGVSSEAAQLLAIFDSVKDVAGPISDILNRGAERLGKGENVGQVNKETFEALREALPAVISRAEETGRPRSEADPGGTGESKVEPEVTIDSGQEDLFSEVSDPGRAVREDIPNTTPAEAASIEREATKSTQDATTPPKEEKSTGKLANQPEQKGEEFDRKFDSEGGFFKIDLVLDAAGKARRFARAFMRRFFTSRGDLPQKVFNEMVRRDGWFNAQMKQVQFTLLDFNKAAKITYGGRNNMTNDQIQAIDAVLKGDAEAHAIPAPMREITQRMRDEIDTLSAKLIEIGAVDGKLTATIEENIGFYAKRSFRAFTDPGWAEKVSIEIRNAAEAHIREQLQVPENLEGLSRRQLLRLARFHGLVAGPSKHPRVGTIPDLKNETLISELKKVTPANIEERMNGIIDGLLYRDENSGSPIALIMKGKLGSKDLSIFKKRKDIAPEILALMGEIESPRLNYANSISSMAGVIANHQFLEQVRRDGMGKFFFNVKTTNDDGSFSKEIAAPESSAMSPLNGLHTTKEILRAFEEALDPNVQPNWLRLYMMANGSVKLAKTVFSPQTHVRNVLGNVGFAVANGHWRIGKFKKAFQTSMASIGAMNDVEYREFFLKLLRLGIVSDTTRAGELRDTFKDVSRGNIDQFMEDSARGKFAGRVVKGTLELYRVEDDVWKVFAYLNEKARFEKALPDASEIEIDERVAEIVRNTYPSYSLVPKAVKLLRRLPFVGTFPSFPAEVARTGFNTITLAIKESSDANPKIRDIGHQRLAGLSVAIGAPAAISIASAALFGISRGDEDDLREFLPPWSENSILVHLPAAKDGEKRYIDLGYSDPYSYLRRPLTAAFRGESIEEGLRDAMMAAFEPFLGEEILFAKILDVRRNTKKSGGRVFNPEDSFQQQSEDIFLHVLDAFEPGASRSARRIISGVRGQVNVYGKSFDPVTESVAVFTGQRISSVDIRQGLTFHISKFNAGIRDSTRILQSVAGRSGKVSNAKIVDAWRRSDRARRVWYDRLSGQSRAAVRLGVPRDEVESMLEAGGVSARNIKEILNGTYRPYLPSSSFISSLSARVDEKEAASRQQLMVKLGIASFDDEFAASVAIGGVISSELNKAFAPKLTRKDRERDESDLRFKDRVESQERKSSQAHTFLSSLDMGTEAMLNALLIAEMERKGKTRLEILRSRKSSSGSLTAFGKRYERLRRLGRVKEGAN